MPDPDSLLPRGMISVIGGTCGTVPRKQRTVAGTGRQGVPGGGAAEMVARLYAESGPALLAYVTGLLGDSYLAEDVVQETMLRAWRHCEQLSDENGSIRGWLLRVARNIAIDKMRMRRCRPAEVTESAAPEPAVGDHADAVVTAVHVRTALAGLPAGHRAVLEQVYLNGLTAAQAAAVLGIPEGTVFSRAYYGLRMLRHQLAAPAPGQPVRTQAAA
jgi:RNA polymerase sigma-70 factor (ECF subfamily)